MDKEELPSRIEETLTKVGMLHAKDARLSTYSKGMLQRIGIAQAIIHKPELLILDEPMSGLDPVGRKLVKDLIRDLQKEGTTVFFSTHILSDVESICDRFVVINAGKTVAEQSIASV